MTNVDNVMWILFITLHFMFSLNVALVICVIRKVMDTSLVLGYSPMFSHQVSKPPTTAEQSQAIANWYQDQSITHKPNKCLRT